MAHQSSQRLGGGDTGGGDTGGGGGGGGGNGAGEGGGESSVGEGGDRSGVDASGSGGEGEGGESAGDDRGDAEVSGDVSGGSFVDRGIVDAGGDDLACLLWLIALARPPLISRASLSEGMRRMMTMEAHISVRRMPGPRRLERRSASAGLAADSALSLFAFDTAISASKVASQALLLFAARSSASRSLGY